MSVDAAVRATPTRPPIHENRRDERANGASQHHTTREGDMVVSEPYERINHWDAPVLTSTDAEHRQEIGQNTRFHLLLSGQYSWGVAQLAEHTQTPSCHGTTVAAESEGGGLSMRFYEIMIILDPDLEEKTIAPSLEAFLNVIRADGGTVRDMEIWGRRRLAYEINHKTEGIYVLIHVDATKESVAELDRQLSLNEAIMRTKVMRQDEPATVGAE